MADEMKLVINGEEIAVNEFVKNILNDVLLAILGNLRGTEDLKKISRIEIS